MNSFFIKSTYNLLECFIVSITFSGSTHRAMPLCYPIALVSAALSYANVVRLALCCCYAMLEKTSPAEEFRYVAYARSKLLHFATLSRLLC